MPSPIPAPLPAWAKTILRRFPAVWAFTLGYDSADYFFDAEPDEDFNWLHVICVAERDTPALTSEDQATISFDIMNITDGAPDSSWTSGDLDDVQGHVAAYLTDLVLLQSTAIAWTEIRFYLRRFATPSDSGSEIANGFADMGDPIRVTPLSGSFAGSDGASGIPYQVAATVTERTHQRRHWGRWYIPNPSSTLFNGSGRFTEAACDALALAAGDFYAALQADEFFPIVTARATRTALLVTSVQVDDIPDIQRRRRPKDTLVRSVQP